MKTWAENKKVPKQHHTFKPLQMDFKFIISVWEKKSKKNSSKPENHYNLNQFWYCYMCTTWCVRLVCAFVFVFIFLDAFRHQPHFALPTWAYVRVYFFECVRAFVYKWFILLEFVGNFLSYDFFVVVVLSRTWIKMIFSNNILFWWVWFKILKIFYWISFRFIPIRRT